eukprot:COSAG02_NODE_443_length_22233_cov_69.528870_9_plen_54_part_00
MGVFRSIVGVGQRERSRGGGGVAGREGSQREKGSRGGRGGVRVGRLRPPRDSL